MKKALNSNMIFITIIAVIVGYMTMFAIKTNNIPINPQVDSRYTSFINFIDELEAETSAMESKIIQVRAEIDSIRTSQTQNTGYLQNLQNLVEELTLTAGYTEVTGKGIILTLDDNNKGAELAKANPQTYYPEEFIVHDKNLLYLIKSICHQAEAISINNQRIVDTSNIRCVGSVIMVNSSRLAPPYEIKAIGNPETLATLLASCGEYVYLKAKEMPITVTKTDAITIPAFPGSSPVNFSTALKEENSGD